MSDQFGIDEAKALLECGWRQAALFDPNEFVAAPSGDKNCFWIVLTQSCTVVSSRLRTDPLVEIATARPIQKFNARSPEAIGKNFRKLHVAVAGSDFEAIEIDVNSRQFLPREMLLKFAPNHIKVDDQGARKIGGWMARYFSRVAVPNRLVEVLKPHFIRISEILRGNFEDGPLHGRIPTIFIDWAPDDEAGPYRANITILADNQATAEHTDKCLIAAKLDELNEDNLKLHIETRSTDATFISDVEGMIRLSEWDYLTGLDAEI